ncbi:MAG: MerR family transcriptional regulator [Gemmatimonadota bacterium]|nr:MerR family transcriptional regulator [Gemmatimonadota bacterium]
MNDPEPTLPGASDRAEHPISVVERRTGVSQHVLRAWERRYGAVVPARDASGQRLYSDADIERLRLLRVVANGGRRVGKLMALSHEQLQQLALADARESVRGSPRGSPPEPVSAGGRIATEQLDACIDAARGMQTGVLSSLLMRAAVALGPHAFIDGVAVPLLRLVGDSWEAGTLRPANEHSLSYALRGVLTWMLDALPAPAHAPTVIVALLPAQRHEFGALFAAIIAATRHWNVSYLGGDLPVADIGYAALVADASVVAVSASGATKPAALRGDLVELRAALPASITLVAGGSAAVTHTPSLRESGAVVLADLNEWKTWLDSKARLLASTTASQATLSRG